MFLQYPKYLEDNKSKLSPKDYTDYTKQYEIMSQICKEFESEKDTDSDVVKDKRMETVMDLMEKMREHGVPPTELVGDMVSESWSLFRASFIVKVLTRLQYDSKREHYLDSEYGLPRLTEFVGDMVS